GGADPTERGGQVGAADRVDLEAGVDAAAVHPGGGGAAQGGAAGHGDRGVEAAAEDAAGEAALDERGHPRRVLHARAHAGEAVADAGAAAGERGVAGAALELEAEARPAARQ